MRNPAGAVWAAKMADASPAAPPPMIARSAESNYWLPTPWVRVRML